MKISLLKLSTVITTAVLIFNSSTLRNSTAEGGEALQFENPDLQIGAVTADQDVPVTFVLTNRSDKAVKIADADASCRCTSLQKSPEEIPAHSNGAFEWTFNSPRATGEVTQTVEINTSDGQTITGQFHATVEPPVVTVALHVSTNTITPPAAIRKGDISGGPGKPLAPGEK
jgi:hypothetical protein